MLPPGAQTTLVSHPSPKLALWCPSGAEVGRKVVNMGHQGIARGAPLIIITDQSANGLETSANS